MTSRCDLARERIDGTVGVYPRSHLPCAVAADHRAEAAYFDGTHRVTPLRFSLSGAERRFPDGHRGYDLAYVAAGLAAYAVNPVRGDRPHRELPRSWAAGDTGRTTLTPRLAALADRYAPPAVLVFGFHQALDRGPKTRHGRLDEAELTVSRSACPERLPGKKGAGMTKGRLHEAAV